MPTFYLSSFQMTLAKPTCAHEHTRYLVKEPDHEFNIGYKCPLGSWVPRLRNTLLLYLSLAKEIHWVQVLQVLPGRPEDLTLGDLPQLQGDLFLGWSM